MTKKFFDGVEILQKTVSPKLSDSTKHLFKSLLLLLFRDYHRMHPRRGREYGRWGEPRNERGHEMQRSTLAGPRLEKPTYVYADARNHGVGGITLYNARSERQHERYRELHFDDLLHHCVLRRISIRKERVIDPAQEKLRLCGVCHWSMLKRARLRRPRRLE